MMGRTTAGWLQPLVYLRQKSILLGALLAIITLLLYAPVAHHGFLQLDDNRYVTVNDHVRTGLSMDNVTWAFTDLGTFYWHPLTWLSHMTDCQLFGLNPGAHHLVNLALHIANALLLFVLLKQATGSVWRSFLVATLFALHPLNVETVAWVAERKSLLSAFFSFITFGVYGWYVQRPGWKRYLAVMAAFLMALMSKPMAVSVPLMLLLFDYWPLNRNEDAPFARRWLRLTLEKLPLFLMSAVSCGLTIVGQRSFGAMASLSTMPVDARVQNALTIYVAYLGKMFWPGTLAAFYPVAQPPLSWTACIASAVVLAGITALVVRFRRARYPIVGWCLFVMTLIPTIGIIQVGAVAMADRFTYIPGIGIFVIVVWALGDAVDAFSIKPIVPAVASLILILTCTAVTRHYLQFWKSGSALLDHARIEAVQPNRLIEEALADSLLAEGRPDEALPHFEESCQLDPSFDFCHYHIAEIQFSRHQVVEALQEYQLALRFTTNKTIAVACLIQSGEALLQLGDYNAAEKQYAFAVSLDPTNGAARRRLGQISAQNLSTRNPGR